MSLGSESFNAPTFNRKPTLGGGNRNACLAALSSSALALLKPHTKELHL